MKKNQHIRFLLLLLVVLTTSNCGIFKNNKIPKELALRYSANANINYGYSFDLKTDLIFEHHKPKDVTDKPELNITVEGASYSRGKIKIDNYPTKFTENIIRVSATYTKDEVSLTKTIEIPFNYKGDVVLNFSGKQGIKGSNGSNGTTPLLFKDGKDGEIGSIGGQGNPGDNLTVYVWKVDPDFYHIKVTNLTNNQTYYYKIKNTGYAFKFDVTGGPGGQGGDGGDGGKGKDGSVTDSKKKDPGNGGNGAIGGEGGTGGKGGSVYIFVHPNASEIQSQFAVYNFGGAGGMGGDGGKAGVGGAAATGQTAGTNGSSGAKGLNGYKGLDGDAFQILIEEFDIEN